MQFINMSLHSSEEPVFRCWQYGDKHDELEIYVQLQCYSLLGIIEMWCNGFHVWNVAIEGCKLFENYRKENEDGELFFT